MKKVGNFQVDIWIWQGCIELIFKIKIAIEDLIEQITNWGLIWN